MPLFDYKCPRCGNEEFDVLQPSDAEPIKCPECGTSMNKVITKAPEAVFKGAGFYCNDKNHT